jgi:hypothetical protein
MDYGSESKRESIPADAPGGIAEGGFRSSVRFGLAIASLGVVLAAAGQFVTGDDYLMMTGLALMALGLGSITLLKMLF